MVIIDKKKYPYVSLGHQYALDVVNKVIPNSVYMIGACQRYLNDLEENDRFYFDFDKAEKYLRVVQNFAHVIGEWQTENIVYQPWQCFVFMNIMGFINKETGFRRYRIAHLEVARGNGKSAAASQMALFFLALDNPKGNQIDCVATRKEQARIVLDSAREMAKKSSSFLRTTGTKVLAHSIVHAKSGSKVVALSSDHSGLDGRNSILAVMDELHQMNPETFNVIYSGMSKRKDSLTLCITTAGFNTDSIGFSQSAYAKKVATGEVEDDQFFSAIYTLDEKDDIWDERNWMKANPCWGVSVDEITFRAKAAKARETPADIPNFKVKHLNLWDSQFVSFYQLAKWDDCYDPNLRIEDFYGKPCYIAIDMASKVDLSSISILFREGDTYYHFDRSYLPEDTVKEVNSPLYRDAIAKGYLIATKGAAIHYPQIKEDILEMKKKFKITEVLYDPWNATEMAQSLSLEKIETVEFRMNTSNLSEPTKILDALMRTKKIKHNGSPLVRFCIGNVVAKEDAAGNVFPRKLSEKLKIDCAISLIMSLAPWLQREQVQSIYSTRGIRSL